MAFPHYAFLNPANPILSYLPGAHILLAGNQDKEIPSTTGKYYEEREAAAEERGHRCISHTKTQGVTHDTASWPHRHLGSEDGSCEKARKGIPAAHKIQDGCWECGRGAKPVPSLEDLMSSARLTCLSTRFRGIPKRRLQ